MYSFLRKSLAVRKQPTVREEAGRRPYARGSVRMR